MPWKKTQLLIKFNDTHQVIPDHRRTEALTTGGAVLTDYRGTAVHDGGLPVFNFEGVRHAGCGAHLWRERNRLEENATLWASAMREFLLGVVPAAGRHGNPQTRLDSPVASRARRTVLGIPEMGENQATCGSQG